MDKLLSFIPALLTGVISPLLGVARGVIDKAQDGVKVVADMSTVNPKKSGAIAVVLGWLGVDPDVINRAGDWMAVIAAWLQAQ